MLFSLKQEAPAYRGGGTFTAAEAYDLAVDKYKPGSKKNNLLCIEDCENCYDKEESISDVHNVIITNESNKPNRKIFILE